MLFRQACSSSGLLRRSRCVCILCSFLVEAPELYSATSTRSLVSPRPELCFAVLHRVYIHALESGRVWLLRDALRAFTALVTPGIYVATVLNFSFPPPSLSVDDLL